MIRVTRLAIVVLLSVLALQCISLAALAPVDDNKYIQAPKLTANSYDFSSEVKRGVTGGPIFTSLMADDWKCPDGKPITDIHWWGSYWNAPDGYIFYSDGLADAQNGGIVRFNIKIYSDIPAGPGVAFSRPGQELWSKSITGNANETFVTSLDKGNGLVESIYKYDVILGQSDWFQQEKDKIYWLSIQADGFDTTARQWGWHEAEGQALDFAVQEWPGSTLYYPCGGRDMAFQLTSVPEPASLMALGLGVIGLGGLIVRRRHQ